MRNIGGLAVENRVQLRVLPVAAADQVLLVFPRELTASDEQERPVLAGSRARSIAKAAKPDIEVFLEFGRFLLREKVVGHQRNVNEPQRLWKTRCISFQKALWQTANG